MSSERGWDTYALTREFVFSPSPPTFEFFGFSAALALELVYAWPRGQGFF